MRSRGVVVKRADSQDRGKEFESRRCNNRNTIVEEGNGKPPREFQFPTKNSEPFLRFLLHLKSRMQRSFSNRLRGVVGVVLRVHVYNAEDRWVVGSWLEFLCALYHSNKQQ